MARIGVRITLAKCLELPIITIDINSTKTRIQRKCLIAYMFSHEVCIVTHAVRMQRMQWCPIIWPNFEVRWNYEGNPIYCYGACSVCKINNEIKISAPDFHVIIGHGYQCGTHKLSRPTRKMLRKVHAYELPYLAFRICERVKDKI